MSALKFALRATACCAAIAVAGAAQGAGFEIREQSSTAQGNAFAGATAGAEDASYQYFNPAAIAYQSGLQASVNGAVILPNAETDNATSANAIGIPLGGGDDATDQIAFVPSSYVSYQVTDHVFVGGGITAPFGLVTKYDTNWAGRYHATHSELRTINVNPNIAFRPVPQVSVAAGFVAQYAYTQLENAVDLGSISGGALGAPGTVDAIGSVRGIDWGFGFTAGVIFEPMEGTRIGLSYRSEVQHDVDGRVRFRGQDAASSAALAAVQGGALGVPAFLDGGAQASVTLPASAGFGVYHEVTDKVALMGDIRWTGWSSFDRLDIDFDQVAPSESLTTEDWDDSFYFALGASYQATEQTKLRFGVAFDQSPVPDEFRTPRIPDADRYWISIGAEHQLTDNLTLTGSYTYIFADEVSIDLDATGENATRGSLEADVSADVHLITFGARTKF